MEKPRKKEYRYFKSRHIRQSSRKGRKLVYSYYSIIGEKDIEITKEDYERSIEQSKKDSTDAFMSRGIKPEYWTYYVEEKKEIDIWNSAIDAMSTWLEGEVPSAKEIYDDLYSSTSLPGYFISDERAKSVILLISQRIHKNLTRKLKGEV